MRQAAQPAHRRLAQALSLALAPLSREQLEGGGVYSAYSGLLRLVLDGVQHRLESPADVRHARKYGVRVARLVSTVLDPANPLDFDEQFSDSDPDEPERRRGVDAAAPPPPPALQVAAPAPAAAPAANCAPASSPTDPDDPDAPVGERGDSEDELGGFDARPTDELSDEDDEFVPYDLPAEEAAGAADEWSMAAAPRYLSDALEGLRSDDYKVWASCLRHIPAVVARSMLDASIAVGALLAVLHLEDRFALPGFEEVRFAAEVAIVKTQPLPCVQRLLAEFYSGNVDLRRRLHVLALLIDVARQLSGRAITLEPPPVPATASVAIPTSVPKAAGGCSGGDGPKTRRWSYASERSRALPKATKNGFAELGGWFLSGGCCLLACVFDVPCYTTPSTLFLAAAPLRGNTADVSGRGLCDSENGPRSGASHSCASMTCAGRTSICKAKTLLSSAGAQPPCSLEKARRLRQQPSQPSRRFCGNSRSGAVVLLRYISFHEYGPQADHSAGVLRRVHGCRAAGVRDGHHAARGTGMPLCMRACGRAGVRAYVYGRAARVGARGCMPVPACTGLHAPASARGGISHALCALCRLPG